MRGSKWPSVPLQPTSDFRKMLEGGRHPMFISEERLARNPEKGGEVLLHICRMDEMLDRTAQPERPPAPRGGRAIPGNARGRGDAVDRYGAPVSQGRSALLEAALLCVSCQVLPTRRASHAKHAGGGEAEHAAEDETWPSSAAARISRCRRADVRIHVLELRKRSAAFQRRFVWPLTDLLEFAARHEDAPHFTLKFVANTQSAARRERRQSWKCVPRRRPSLEREAAALVLAASSGPGGKPTKSFDFFHAMAFIPAELQCLAWILTELCILRGTPLITLNVRSLELGLHGAKYEWPRVYHLHEFITVSVLLDAEEEETQEVAARRAGASPTTRKALVRRGSEAGLTAADAEAAADAAMKLWDGGDDDSPAANATLDAGGDDAVTAEASRAQTLEQEEMLALLRSAYVLHAIDKSRVVARGVHHGFVQHARIEGGLREEESSLQRLDKMLLEEEVHEASELMQWHSARIGGGAVDSNTKAAPALAAAKPASGHAGGAEHASAASAVNFSASSIAWVCRSLDDAEASLSAVSRRLGQHDDRLRNVTSAMKLLQKRNNLLRRVHRNQEKLNAGVEKMLRASELPPQHAHCLRDSAENLSLASMAGPILGRLLEAARALSNAMDACKAADIEAMHELRKQLQGLAHKFAQAVCDRLIEMASTLALSIDSRAAAERDIDFDPGQATEEEREQTTEVWKSDSDAESVFVCGLIALTRSAVQRREELARLGSAVRAAVDLDDSETVAGALRCVLIDTQQQCSRLARALCESALATVDTFVDVGVKAQAKAIAYAAHLKDAKGDAARVVADESDRAVDPQAPEAVAALESGGGRRKAWGHLLGAATFADDRFAKMPHASLKSEKIKLANARGGALSALWLQFSGQDLVSSVDAQLGAAHTNAITGTAILQALREDRRPSRGGGGAHDGIEAWEELRRLQLKIAHGALESGASFGVSNIAEWIPVAGPKLPAESQQPQTGWGGGKWYGGDEGARDETRVRDALCLKPTMAPPMVLSLLFVAVSDAVRAEVEVLRTLFLSIDPLLLLADLPDDIEASVKGGGGGGGGGGRNTDAGGMEASLAELLRASETSGLDVGGGAKGGDAFSRKKRRSTSAKAKRKTFRNSLTRRLSNLGSSAVSSASSGAAHEGAAAAELEESAPPSPQRSRLKNAMAKVRISHLLARGSKANEEEHASDISEEDDDTKPQPLRRKTKSIGMLSSSGASSGGGADSGGGGGDARGANRGWHTVHFEVALQLVRRVWSPLDAELARLVQRLFVEKDERANMEGAKALSDGKMAQWRRRYGKWSHKGPLLPHSLVALISAVGVTSEAADESQQLRKESGADLARLVQLHDTLVTKEGEGESTAGGTGAATPAAAAAAAATFGTGQRRRSAGGEQDLSERVVELKAEIKRRSYIAAADVFLSESFATLHQNTLKAFDKFWSDQIAWMKKLKAGANLRYATILSPISRLPIFIERLLVGAAPFLGAATRTTNVHAGSVVTHSMRTITILAIERLVSAAIEWLPQYAASAPRGQKRHKYTDIIILENSYFLYNALEERKPTLAQRLAPMASRAINEIFDTACRHIPEMQEMHRRHRTNYVAWLIEEEWEQLQRFFADVERMEAKVTAANVRPNLALPSNKVLPRDGSCKVMIQASVKHMAGRVAKHFSSETQLQSSVWAEVTAAAVREWGRFATLAHDCYAITLWPSAEDLEGTMEGFGESFAT